MAVEPLTLYYFVGRMNPPHPGHLATLVHMISQAKANGGTSLILLGSGPNGGMTTMDDPIGFDLKKAFLEYKLSEYGFTPEDYTIMEKTNPVEDVTGWCREKINATTSVELVHIAGDKDGNSEKLSFINRALNDTTINGAVIRTSTKPYPAVESNGGVMSATTVRKDAYECFLSHRKHQFLATHTGFYGEFTDRIYEAIVNGAKGASNEEIHQYIQHKQLPSIQTDYINAIKSAVAAVTAEKKLKLDASKKDKLDKAKQKVKDTEHRIRLIEAALESAVPGHKAEISGAAAMANTPHNSRGTKRKDEKGAENKKKGAENKKPSRRGGKKTRTRRSRR